MADEKPKESGWKWVAIALAGFVVGRMSVSNPSSSPSPRSALTATLPDAEASPAAPPIVDMGPTVEPQRAVATTLAGTDDGTSDGSDDLTSAGTADLPETVAPVYYANCSEARAAGAAPIRAGEPGYAAHLDRDGDGVACE